MQGYFIGFCAFLGICFAGDAWASPMPFVVQNQGQIEVTGKASDVVFDPSELNLGDIVEGEKVAASVLIRNTGNIRYSIVNIESSCGCTTVEPDTRILEAGSFTRLHIHIDTFGKRGKVKKSIVLTDQKGNQSTLWLHLQVKKNPHLASSSRSIFDGACASCHFEPAQGKQTGKAIYAAVCAMCHGQGGQGAYAPKLVGHHDVNVLKYLIEHGTGTHHMPAFAQKLGGPLSTMQINALSGWIISLDDK